MEKQGEVDPWVTEKFRKVRQFNWQYPGYRKHISDFGWNYSHEFLELAKQEISSTPVYELPQA
jgi:hypothetical protein